MEAIRIEKVFDDPQVIRALVEHHGPYRALASYLPVSATRGEREATAARGTLPWFRSTWAANGRPLVEGAELILENPLFREAASRLFDGAEVTPNTIAINVNAPMPAGGVHVDIPSFRGATRDRYPIQLLQAMGSSGLFEPWRVIEAGAVVWFYEGPVGEYEYWPDGLSGPKRSVRAPLTNRALVADNDRMYHRIGPIGDADATPPRISASAEIQPAGEGDWAIVENGEVRAAYPDRVIRLSLVWKAEVRDRELKDVLSLDRIMAIFTTDLRRRSVGFDMPSNPLADAAWLLLLQRTYTDPILTTGE